tara:strand:- start:1003 stop:2028 length:1026 start_codon:yes stop_codon:yes gene_type:complete
MQPISSKVFLNGESVDFITANLKKQGGFTATGFTFTLPKTDVSFRKYWNQEVLFYIDKSDAYPTFRGRVSNVTIVGEREVQFNCVDALGYLTGHYKARITLDATKNVDGMSAGSTIRTIIKMANLQDIVGTDYIGDTSPVIQMPVLRGTFDILDIIKKAFNTVLTNDAIPRENIIRVIDDGTKSQLIFEKKSDVDTATVVKRYDYNNNIISFKVNDRKIPTTVIVEGNGGMRATFRHSSAAAALGENYMTVKNDTLKSRADCMDWGQKVFNANLKNQYEYILDTFDGIYLEPNDVIHITDKKTGTSGNYVVIGKMLSCGANVFRLQLTINKRPPILSEFIL